MDNLAPVINQKLSRELQSIIYLIKYWSGLCSCNVYAVGGFVRDLLMGQESADIDLVVEGSAVDFAQGLCTVLPGKLTTYEKFGTATLAIPGKSYLDLVTARQEFYPSPGALPEVQRSSLKKDLYRRDFTINTMACELTHDRFGRLYDYFGGQEDLQNGLIRTLYKLSFVDDPLRILRALRFEQRFDFVLEKETRNSLLSAVSHRMLERVSKDRLYSEVRLVFKERVPSRVLARFKELGLWGYLFPRISLDSMLLNDIVKMEQLLADQYSGASGKHLNRMVIYLALFFQNASTHDRKYLSYLMRLRKKEREKLFALLEKWPAVKRGIEKSNLNNAELYFLLEGFPREGFPLLEAFSSSSRVGERLEHYRTRLSRLEPEVSGKDLLEMGLKPGPIYNKLLKNLHEAVLDGKVKGRKEEMEYINELLEKDKEM